MFFLYWILWLLTRHTFSCLFDRCLSWVILLVETGPTNQEVLVWSFCVITTRPLPDLYTTSYTYCMTPCLSHLQRQTLRQGDHTPTGCPLVRSRRCRVRLHSSAGRHLCQPRWTKQGDHSLLLTNWVRCLCQLDSKSQLYVKGPLAAMHSMYRHQLLTYTVLHNTNGITCLKRIKSSNSISTLQSLILLAHLIIMYQMFAELHWPISLLWCWVI